MLNRAIYATIGALLLTCYSGRHGAAAPSPPQPTFSLDFENGIQATGKDGKTLAGTVEGKTEIVPGKFGMAFKSGPESGYLHFPTKDIVSPAQGTVEMWVCPLDWSGAEQKFHVFFDARGEGALYLYKYYQGGLLMLTAPQLSGPLKSAKASIDDWKPGEWHHIAGTWSAHHQAVYVDGKLFGTAEPGLPAHLDGDFTLGDNPWPENIGPRTSQSLIDRVRIYDRELSPEHIAAHFAGDYDKVVAASKDNTSLDYQLDRDKRQIMVQLNSLGADAVGTNPQVQFALSQNGKPVVESPPVPFQADAAQTTLALVQLAPGNYELSATLRDGSTEILKQTKTLPVPSFEWMNNQIAEGVKVLPPWTPLKVQKSRDGVGVECWGRTYQFGNSPLPIQIVAKGEKLLASPMAFRAGVGGKSLTWMTSPAQVTSATPAVVTIEGKAQAATPQGAVVLTTHYRIEYDGLIVADFKLSAPTGVKLDNLTLDIPMQAERALYRHRWTASWQGKTGQLAAGQGAVDQDTFIPYAWLGDNDRGLFWFCESAEHWPNWSSSNAWEARRENGAVTMRLNLVQGQALTGDWNYEFGLQATPVKPLPKGWRQWRLQPAPRAKVSIMWPTPQDDSQLYYGYPQATNPALFKKRVDELHAQGIKAIPYSCISFFSSAAPEWPWFRKEWSMGSGDSSSSDVAAYNASFEMVSPRSQTFQDFIIWKNKQFMDQFGLDGYYHDNTHPYGATLADAGLGWTDGKQRYPTYPILAYRDLYRRMYTLVKTAKPDSFLMAHMSGKLTIPILSYEDSYLDGEHFRGRVKDSYMDVSTLDEWRTEYMGRQWGIMPYFLPEFDADNAAKIEPTRGLVALLLLHDIAPWPIWCNAKVFDTAFDALDEFGYMDSDFVPYFDPQPPAHTDMKDVYASAYKRKDGRVLLVVANTSKEDRSGSVQLNWKSLGVPSGSVIDWPSRTPVVVENGQIKLDVQRLGYRLLLIGKPPAKTAPTSKTAVTP